MSQKEQYLLQAYAYQKKAKNAHEILQDAQRLQEIERLKQKYNVRCESSLNQMIHPILQKLQEQRRLTPDEFLWLHDQRILSHVILNAYHQIEAIFFERQYQDTKDLWNLVNASSHWRKADEPQRALSTTANIQFETVGQPKLKSALLTTRGGAFRDVAQTRNATKCAIQAMECYPKTHQPYTLRGAICYDEGNYENGDHWFQEAIQRGATPNDVNTELVSIVKKAKGEQRRKLIDHLLRKDPKVYEWLKRFTR